LREPFSGGPLGESDGGVAPVAGDVVRATNGAHGAVASDHLAEVIEQLPVGVLIADAPRGGIALANYQARRVLGCPDALPGCVAEYVRWRGCRRDGRPYLPEEWPLARALGYGEVVVAEVVRCWIDESAWVDVSINASPVRDADGRIVAAVAILRDITEHAAAEAQTRRTISLLRATIEATTDGILVVDRSGRIVQTNRRFAEIWRLPDDVLAANDDAKAIGYVLDQVQDPEGFVRKIREHYAHPAAESFDVLPFKDGRIIERYSYPQRLGEEIVGRVWSFRDVTEQRGMLNALRQSERRYRELFEDANDIVFTIDGEGNFTALNRAAEDVLECPRAEGLTMNVRDVVVRERLTAALRSVERVRRGERLPPFETTLVTRRGRRRELEVSIRLQGQGGEIQGIARDVTGRKRAETALRESEARFRRVLEQAGDAVLLHDAQGRLFDVNARACETLGYTREELLALNVADLECDTRPEQLLEAWAGMTPGEHRTLRGVHRRKDGSEFSVEVRVGLSELEGQRLLLSLVRDVTDRERLELQLRQAQKMEAVGRLAGGIAHDFNNLLTAILGTSDLLVADLDPRDHRRDDIEEIRKSARRAADLTRQLLAFSRRQVLAPRVLVVNDVIANLQRMLARLIGEDVVLQAVLPPGVGRIKADPGQVEQVIINLAVNARDAMPQGGSLTIATDNVEILSPLDGHSAAPGAYVRIRVTDTGRGMDAETRAHIFEPFYTTKGPGKGTGLGLATVYGIVKQSGGHVEVETAPDAGTTFSVFFPRVEEAADIREHAPMIAPPRGSETVLVVEDEAAVRRLTSRVLETLGYNVLVASSGEEALQLSGTHAGRIHLLMTDVVMPGMSGRELAERLSGERTDMKALYVSGYTDDAIVHHGVLRDELPFLQKPFTPNRLAERVREVLGAG